MGITYNDSVFHLFSNDVSYVFYIKEGKPVHLYWGKAVSDGDLRYTDVFFISSGVLSGEEIMRMEMPMYSTGDYRNPMLELEFENGSRTSDFRYKEHDIIKGKPLLEGLPATYVCKEDEAQTLILTLEDTLTGVLAKLYYTIFENGAIARSMQIVNKSSESIRINRALSTSVDFSYENMDIIHLHGTWARERHIERLPVKHMVQSVGSTRGASSHAHNPFIAYVDKNADEDNGNAYGFSLVYSGSFIANSEQNAANITRVQIGINPFDFSWLLNSGESFQTPEAVMVYSDKGLGKMSRTYHKLYRTRLCRGKFRDKVRPILINNWEATYFDFNEEKILNLASIAKDIGVELFVLDDGWFGVRNAGNCSLGDWCVNKKKLPSGLSGLADKLNNMGLKFGLWFEPEMISPDSDLYRAHPDWCLHVEGRHRTTRREQLILDLSRDDVCDYIIETVSDVLKSANIEYVKWDYNRNMTEISSALQLAGRQKETAHRYMLGLYRVLEEITSRFPDILFESCSGGGGRFDPGMLYYMPQTWTSDDTDASERVKIQYGTSIVYPASAMGSHVSECPNHQTKRTTPLKTRFEVALSGNFGYELDITKMDAQEINVLKEQVVKVKELRELIQKGDFYRISSPFESNITAWQYVSENEEKSMFFVYRDKFVPSSVPRFPIKLKGLCPESKYYVSLLDKELSGDVLMNVGIVPFEWDKGDFSSTIFELKKV